MAALFHYKCIRLNFKLKKRKIFTWLSVSRHIFTWLTWSHFKTLKTLSLSLSLCLFCHALNRTMKETCLIILYEGLGWPIVSGCVLSWDSCNAETQQGEAGSCLSIYISLFSNNTKLWTSQVQQDFALSHPKTIPAKSYLYYGFILLLIVQVRWNVHINLVSEWREQGCK